MTKVKKEKKLLAHSKMLPNWEEFIPNDAKFLILGSFPSESTKKQRFYYGNKKNVFWKEYIGAKEHPNSPKEAIKLCKEKKVALYDVVEKAYFDKDRTYQDPKEKDIRKYADKEINEILINRKNIKYIFVLSKSASCIFATKIYNKLNSKRIKAIKVVYNVPSSSSNRNNQKNGKREDSAEFKLLRELIK